MGKLTLEDLKKLREEGKKNFSTRDVSGKTTTILVGMGTCGIAAGARETLNTFVSEAEKMGLTDVIIKPTGCMGACSVEPTVEVICPDMPTVLYGNVNSDVAKKILDKHIVHKELINDHIFDKPAVDIMK